MPVKKTALTVEKQTQKNFLNMLIMLSAPSAMAWYYYGLRSLMLIAVCIGSAAVSDFFGGLIIKSKKKSLYDFSAVFTGVVIALMLPASFPFTLAAAGCAFAIIVAKLPFGTAKNAPFVPAAAGFAFMCVCWPDKVFEYPAVSAQLEMFSTSMTAAVPGSSLAAMLQSGNSMRITPVNVLNILTGNFTGPMGTGCILVLLAAAVYFLFTRPSVLLNSLGMIMSCAVMALLFPRIVIGDKFFTGLFSSLIFEICSGSLVFVALFILTDAATSPQKPLSRLLYGVFAGIICMSMRYFGIFEKEACFAVLLANAAWPMAEIGLNKIGNKLIKSTHKKPAVPSAAIKGGRMDA